MKLTFWNMFKKKSNLNSWPVVVTETRMKGYRLIDQLVFEKIFAAENINTYKIKNLRWYVCSYNIAYFIHYTFIYSKNSVTIRYKIAKTKKETELTTNHIN